jgi:nitroimidazol reductase NimA-like FMN-containing flavoprotein (pyridoxamine 5'-phosphate oxidase superfamily)
MVSQKLWICRLCGPRRRSWLCIAVDLFPRVRILVNGKGGIMTDEPVLGSDFGSASTALSADESVVEAIRALVQEQPFAVLCTQGQGQPYGSVVAFAHSPDLESFVFATPRATRKYRLLSESNRVALVVDNRGSFPGELMRVAAITITGRARQLDTGVEAEKWGHVLTERHPYLKSFVASPSTALFHIDAVRFLYVTRFQEVTQWTPAAHG